MAPAHSAYTLRPATRADGDFASRVKLAGLRAYLEPVPGFDADRLRRQYQADFAPTEARIVVVGEADVGVLRVVDREGAVFLAEIYLVPDAQGRGIGSRVITDVIRKAHGRGRAVRLQLLRPNPARRLYERLGFRLHGETSTHFRMELPPPPGAPDSLDASPGA